jgi:hypothetical protein
MKFSTVNEANQALDCYMKLTGYHNSCGHYNRPDKTRGPAVNYTVGAMRIMFAVDRDEEGWRVSDCWLMQHWHPAIRLSELLDGFYVMAADQWPTDIDWNGFLYWNRQAVQAGV